MIGLGAATPIGRDAWSTAAAVRAKVSGFTNHPFMIDTVGEPMRVALAPWLDVDVTGVDRFEALLVPAIDQALAEAAGRLSDLRVLLCVGLPAPRPGLPGDLAASLSRALAKRYAAVFSAFRMFPNGHAAGLLALNEAGRQLSRDGCDLCVVAGVDSYVEPETLEWIEECDQFHGAGAQNNAWGFIPGEASGALLVAGRRAAKPFAPALARVAGVGLGIEPNRIKTDTVCIGLGLTAAFHDAFSMLPDGEAVSDIYCDLNGEPYRADEYGFACLRRGSRLTSASDFHAPADCLGDVSAAGGPLSIALSAIAGLKGYANGPWSLVWGSSEGGERAAALLQTRSGG